MSNEIADQVVDTGVSEVIHLKTQTAEALEEAARDLRRINISTKGEDLKQILHDIEAQVDKVKADLDDDYRKIESDYHKRTKPLEQILIDHPVPSILVAAGAGLLIGLLIGKMRN